MSQTPVRQYLKDYTPPLFQTPWTHLSFDIQESGTRVINHMKVESKSSGPLVLYGPRSGWSQLLIRNKEQESFQALLEDHFTFQDQTLTITVPYQEFELKIETQIKPQENTELLGLYQTGTGLCTQCEPEGFRNITFFQDRPDVMSRYKVTIMADKEKYPILLSNGNRTLVSELESGRHSVQWEDPFPKPSYLFALVAGDYGIIKDHFITMSGRKVDLEIYCEHGNEFQCHHAMNALKRSMKWDEDTYGREYDLNQYLILAVDDFNGGAMENKGLNIFNSRLIFSDTTTATDGDFTRVEAVIAHEYFHNWTGNRITLRDWFQLSLKEGLTVFREQHYMGDLSSEAVNRIDEVEFLRARQFPEDAGPNAHPVRPESCLAVDNFYTTTVYEKGAELIRVLKQLLGPNEFKKGMDNYFNLYDGHAITIEDFLLAFENSSKKSLTEFRKWYSFAGTPKIAIRESYDEKNQIYQLEFSQNKENPFVIPMKMSLFSPSTKKEISLTNSIISNSTQTSLPTESSKNLNENTEILLELSKPSTVWKLENCTERPIPSLFRGMTSPVLLNWEMSDDQLEFLAQHDTDGFNQWESLQKLALKEIIQCYFNFNSGKTPLINKNYVALYKKLLIHSLEKPELTSRLLQLPGYEYAMQILPLELNPDALASAFEFLKQNLAQALNEELWKLDFEISTIDKPQDYSFSAMGIRKLRHTIWNLLGFIPTNIPKLASKFSFDKPMNDQAGILESINSSASKERTELLHQFAQHWKASPLVINKWLSWEATLDQPETINRVAALSQKEEVFKVTNPNKVRALLHSFAVYCPRGFHRDDGTGYSFFAEKLLEVDAVNPATAARLSQCFENGYRLESKRRSQVYNTIETLVKNPKLSKNSFEILKRSLDFTAEAK